MDYLIDLDRITRVFGSFQALCAASHDAIHRAAVDYYSDPGKDVQAFRTAVLTAFAAMSTQIGYVAAQLQISGLPTPSLDDGRLDERMLGEAWKQVIARLRELPSAEKRVERDELEGAVLAAAGLLAEWLGQIGFKDEPLEDGTLFFHVFEHEDWVQRGVVGEELG